MIKTYRDEVPPSSGRKYKIETVGEDSTITDVTQYEVEGTTFGARDVQGVCILEGTHTLNGTVHNITIGNDNVENIKFKATGDFDAGNSIKINNEPYSFAKPVGEDVFKTGNTVYASLDNQNKTIQILNPGSDWYWCDKSTANEVYAWLNAFPEGIYHVAFSNSASLAIGAVAVQHAGIFYVLKIGNAYCKELNICNITSKKQQVSYIGNVNTTTGKVVLSRVDNQLTNLPSEAQATIQDLQKFIDERDLGHSVYYSNTIQSSSIRIPDRGAFTLDIRQSENNGKSCMIVATPWEETKGKWRLKKGGFPSSSWANDWTWEGEDMRNMIFDTTQGTNGFNALLQSLQRGHYVCHANITRATAAGLPSNSLGYKVTIEKITNSALIVKATPWDNPLITYYTNQTYLTSGWKKVTLTEDVG